MKKLLTYLKDYKKESILAPLFKLLEASFELFVPLVVASIIDHGIGDGDRGYVLKMTLVLVALGLIGLICAVTAQYFAAKASVGFAGGLRRALFEKIQTFSYAQLDKIGVNTLINRMTGDVNQVQSALNLTLRLFLRSPVVVFGAMIMAFTIDISAALIFVVTIPLLSVVVFGIMLITIPLYRKVQEKLDRVLGITRENLTGVRVIRAFCKEEDETEDFDRRNADLNKMQRRVGILSALMNPLTYVIVNLAIVWLIHTGADLVNGSSLSQGEVVALYNYMSQILIELIKLANLIITMTRGFAGLSRIGKILDADSAPAPIDGTQEKTAYTVELRDVSLAYPGGGDEALSHISLAVKKGETVGIIGGTGSGKSTLVQLIPRLYDVSEGAVFVGGKNVKEYDLETLRDNVAMVLQKNLLFSGTIRENLKWGNKNATDEELIEACQFAQAHEFISTFPDGYDTYIEQGGTNVSGGQKQRLCIARALLKKQKVLILDDSTSAVDTKTDALIRKAFKEYIPETTKIIIAQRIASVSDADMIIVMNNGRVMDYGTHDQLMERNEIYRETYYEQTQGGKDDE
ncbi:MAG: ABC transporter ATP-binding protein [Clostridia bacterium]|nr:ABC transporter ATP-binding protein [Clostridia bacterium]